MIRADQVGFKGETPDDLDALASFAQGFADGKALTREQWLEERGRGIGGSDAPVVLGLSPWKTRLELWGEKSGTIPAPVLDSDAVEMGHELEPIALRRYAKKSGRPAVAWPSTLIVQHADPAFPWALCTPDGLTFDRDRGLGLVQVKTTGEYNRDDWEEGVPLHVEAQVQHEMEVTGATWATVVVLIGGRSIKWFDLVPLPGFVAVMLEREADFWSHVVERRQPVVTAHDAAVGQKELGRTLAKLHGDDNGDTVLLGSEAVAWDERLRAIKEEQKELQAERETLEALIVSRIGPATVGVLPNGRAYSWKSWTRNGYTVGPTSGRTLRQVGH